MRKFMKWGAIAFAGLIALSVLGSAVSGGSSSSSAAEKSDGSAQVEQKQEKREKRKDSCGTRATDDCTPRVAMGGSVRVDALYWKVTDVRTAATIGDMQYGLGEKADGTFLVVDLSVRSAKDESVTLSDDSIELVTADGKSYKADSDGTIAAMGEGENPLFFEDIGPDSTISSKVVFDVPASALASKLSVRFNELGFGTTHAFITLPKLSA
jgi:Domain of unknown function (DUF4352)